MSALNRIEAAKYEKMWAGHYRGAPSPGLACVEKAHAFFQRPNSLYDFGCGAGKATKAFSELGYQTLGIDHAINSVETDITFMRAPIWDIPFVVRPCYSFCVDVLEHIPPERITDVLDVLSNCEEAAFVQISLREDFGGKKIGEVLHLTVKPKEWWLELLFDYFNIDHYETPAKDVLDVYLHRL